MNFEIIDNAYQISMFGAASVISTVLSVRFRDRRFMILSFAYACFMMGTLFYTLHLAITGDIPRISYVSEILWIASYLFYLSLQLYRSEKMKIHFSWLSVFAASVAVKYILEWHIMGPSYLTNILFAVTLSVIVYLSVYRIKVKTEYIMFDIVLLICTFLQVALYISSAFMDGFTEFNLYFTIDMTLTTCFAMLIPLMYREVKKR